MKRSKWVAMGCLVGFFYTTGAGASDTFLEQADALIKANKFKEAYELLASKERTYAGNFDYDFLLGVAALDAGMPRVSIFALERAVATRPNDASARVAIARNYYALGERQTARTEFETVRGQKLPPEVLTGVERYLAALDRRPAKTSDFSGFVGVAFGYDDNINSATEEVLISIPAFSLLGLATLSPEARERGDEYLQLSAGIGYQHKVGANSALVAGANLSQKFHFDGDDLDIGVFSGSLGYLYASGANRLSLATQGQIFTVGYDNYRRTYGLSAQWDHTLSSTTLVGLSAQVLELDYPDQPVRDATRYSGGAKASLKFGANADGSMPGVVLLQGYVGAENEKASTRPDMGHSFWGLSAALGYQLSDTLSGRVSTSYESRDYGGTDPLFLVGRSDDNWRISGAVTVKVTDRISLIPELSYSRNKSNIVINDYDRFVAQLGARLSF